MDKIIDAEDAIMKQSLNLKPCPFCGSPIVKLDKYHLNRDASYYVVCRECYAYTEFVDETMEGTIEAWNKRDGISSA